MGTKSKYEYVDKMHCPCAGLAEQPQWAGRNNGLGLAQQSVMGLATT